MKLSEFSLNAFRYSFAPIVYFIFVLISAKPNAISPFRYSFAPIVYFIFVLISAKPNAISLFAI